MAGRGRQGSRSSPVIPTRVERLRGPRLACSHRSRRRRSSRHRELSSGSPPPGSGRSLPHDSANETGIDVGLRDEGTLAIAFDDDDHRHLEELARVHRLLELESEWLDARDCRALEPLLSPRIRGGLRVSGDWQVDNRALVAALISAMTARGVDVRRCALRALTGTEERITGGELEDGSVVSSETVVVAAGPWSPAIAGLPAVARPPVRPVKGDIIRLLGSTEDPILSRSIRAGVRGKDVYLVPRRNGEVVIGASVEEAGFSTAARAPARSSSCSRPQSPWCPQ